MPNGGIDNCLTCWFNAKNKGVANVAHHEYEGEDFCLIRQLRIEGNPVHTYCANSPFNTSESLNPVDKIEVPVGGVYKAAIDTHIGVWPPDPYARVLWQAAPDTEEIRQRLLEMLKKITEIPAEYGGEMPWDDMVIFQLGEYREKRAVVELQRIVRFNPGARAPGKHRNREITVWLAERALWNIR
jgi:hypothetical protein